MLAKLFRSRQQPPAPQPSLPPGERVYAIGDVHGCLDLLDGLLAMIDADNARRGPARTTVILLGDLVDRGPDSAGVVRRLRHLARQRFELRFIAGNHEELFLAALAGEPPALRVFCRAGGRETALSYGIDPADYDGADYDELAQMLAEHVPTKDRDFLEAMEDMIVMGDYAFVHAGIDPSLGLDAQTPAQTRWIRDRFLDHRGPLDKVFVHGHTISQTVEYRPHRIGIDTGAYETGRLSALGLEGVSTWELQTGT